MSAQENPLRGFEEVQNLPAYRTFRLLGKDAMTKKDSRAVVETVLADRFFFFRPLFSRTREKRLLRFTRDSVELPQSGRRK